MTDCNRLSLAASTQRCYYALYQTSLLKLSWKSDRILFSCFVRSRAPSLLAVSQPEYCRPGHGPFRVKLDSPSGYLERAAERFSSEHQCVGHRWGVISAVCSEVRLRRMGFKLLAILSRFLQSLQRVDNCCRKQTSSLRAFAMTLPGQ